MKAFGSHPHYWKDDLAHSLFRLFNRSGSASDEGPPASGGEALRTSLPGVRDIEEAGAAKHGRA
jgi:hypothetical protein